MRHLSDAGGEGIGRVNGFLELGQSRFGLIITDVVLPRIFRTAQIQKHQHFRLQRAIDGTGEMLLAITSTS